MQQVGRKVRAMREKGTTRAATECGGNKRNGEAASLRFPVHQSLGRANGEERLGEEFRVNNLRETCHAMASKKPRLLQSKWVVIAAMASQQREQVNT